MLLFVVVDSITIRIEISLHLYILLSDPIWKIKYINRFTPLETDQSLDNIFPDIPSPFCSGLPSKNQGFKSINFNSLIKPYCKDCKKGRLHSTNYSCHGEGRPLPNHSSYPNSSLSLFEDVKLSQLLLNLSRLNYTSY